jgi:hypothetical protein
MAKAILTFCVLFVIILLVITAWSNVGSAERWKTVKVLGMSLGISFVCVCVLTSIVILF